MINYQLNDKQYSVFNFLSMISQYDSTAKLTFLP